MIRKLTVAGLLKLCLCAAAFAQMSDWTPQMPAFGHGTVSNQQKIEAVPVSAQAKALKMMVDLKCDPRSNQPTNTIQDLWIEGQRFTAYDGGYVPYSKLHTQGYELSLVDGIDVFLRDNDTQTGLVLGTLQGREKCTWEAISRNKIQIAPKLQVTLLTGPSRREEHVIDMEPRCSKLASLTVIFQPSGKTDMTLESMIGNPDCNSPLGDTAEVFLPSGQ